MMQNLLNDKQHIIFCYPDQGGITCGAINEASRSSKAIEKHLIINFRDKNVIIARFRVKNEVFILFIFIYIYFSIHVLFIFI